MTRVALVIDGMSELSEAICLKLAALDYRVVVTHSFGNNKADDWLARTKSAGFNFYACAFDFADHDCAHRCVIAVEREIGPVEVLINNAFTTCDITLGKMNKPDSDAFMRTNLNAGMNMIKSLCDNMVERGWGRIINISPVTSQSGALRQADCAAAKAGMDCFTKALAQEVVSKAVTVNTISPIYLASRMATAMAITEDGVNTNIVPQLPTDRSGKPEEIAGLVAYLASDEAAFVTGANIMISGDQQMA